MTKLDNADRVTSRHAVTPCLKALFKGCDFTVAPSFYSRDALTSIRRTPRDGIMIANSGGQRKFIHEIAPLVSGDCLAPAPRTIGVAPWCQTPSALSFRVTDTITYTKRDFSLVFPFGIVIWESEQEFFTHGPSITAQKTFWNLLA